MQTSEKTGRHRSLTLFLTFAVFSAIFFPILGVGSFEVYRQYEQQVLKAPEEEAEALFIVLKKGLTAPLWSYTPENAVDLINGVTLNPSVEKILVKDATGTTFTEYERDHISPESEKISLSSPVFFNDQLIGTVDLVFDYSSAKAAVSDYARQIIFITVIQVVVTILIILLILKYRVTEPLRSLKQFAVEISKQNFESPSPKVKNREFIELVDELDLMKNALRSSFVELEHIVAQRTDSLTKSNLELESALKNIERAQETLVQNEKLAALGALVAGVAHELNTPIGNARLVASTLHEDTQKLTGLVNSGKLTKSEFDSLSENIDSATNLIEQNISKAVTLIQNFKQVAVDRTSDRKREFSLNSFIEEVESTLLHIVKSKPIEIHTDFDVECKLYTYPGTLSQVIDNLVNNAVLHAFENKELSAESPGLITISTKVDEDMVSISIADNGVGLSTEMQAKIYEPFFTTKLGKGGSGLGMHIVHNLVTGPLEGRIDLESEANKGATFTIVIPKKLSPDPEDEML